MVHIVAHVTDLGFSLATGAYVLAVITAVSAVGGIGAGRLADRIGNKPVLMISYTATAVVLLWALVAEELWMLYLFAVIYGFGRGGREVIRFSLTSEVFGLKSLGVIMGTIHFGASVWTFLGPLLSGRIFDVTGNYNLAFLVLAAIAVIGFISTWLATPPSGKIKEGMA